MKYYIKLLRPHQYVKNIFILSPLFFSFKFRDTDLLFRVLLVTACFCLVASAIYILNDYLDIEEDRKHPTKKNRPLASGKVPKNHALIIMVLLVVVGAGGMTFVSINALILTGIYVLNNILYSYRLKHVPLLDISMISIGFVLRLFIGEAAGEGELPLSMWIILCTFLLAMFLAMAKRRDDVLLHKEGKQVRKSIDGYNLEFINGGMMIMASVTLVAYISYTISPDVTHRLGTENLYFTVFFVIIGILRYMQITFVEQKSGSPTKVLLKDLFLQLTLVGWVLSFIFLVPVLRDLIFGNLFSGG